MCGEHNLGSSSPVSSVRNLVTQIGNSCIFLLRDVSKTRAEREKEFDEVVETVERAFFKLFEATLTMCLEAVAAQSKLKM